MKDFLIYFFGQGTEPEFSIFTLAHLIPVLLMLLAIFGIWKKRDEIRKCRFEETFRYILAFALIICDMSYYWRLAGGAPWLSPGPVENLPIGVQATTREGENGKYLFVMNYTRRAVQVPLPAGVNALTGEAVGGKTELGVNGVIIVKVEE